MELGNIRRICLNQNFQTGLLRNQLWRTLGSMEILEVEGMEVQVFPDMAPVTLQKRRQFKILMERLIKDRIRSWWGFPIKLLVAFRDRKIIIRTAEEARMFLELLDKQPREGQTSAQEDTAQVESDTQDEAITIG